LLSYLKISFREVKTIRVDNGREYCNAQMTRYLCAKGINLETTASYTPEQNGRTRQRGTRQQIFNRKCPSYAARQGSTHSSMDGGCEHSLLYIEHQHPATNK